MKFRATLAVTAAVVLTIGIAIFGCGSEGGGSSSTPSSSNSTGSSTGSTTASTTGSTTSGTTGSSTGSTTGSAPATATIAAINNAAAPMGFSFQSPVTVKSGTHVTWVNNSSAPHTIIFD